MANLVTYGDFDFSSVCGGVDPFVGVSDEQILVGGKFKTLKRITVQGKIITDYPYCPNASIITLKINTLLSSLKNDFSSLNAGNLNLDIARCESIDIDQSNFFNGASFTVNFLGYPSQLSDFGFDVLDPTDNKQIKENNDGTISITRSISARGITTSESPNAIANARSFIQSLNASGPPPSIFFPIGQLTSPGNSLEPKRVVETVNRIEGIVNLDIEYIYRNTVPNNSIILSYTVDVSYDDKSGIYTVSLNGNFTGVLTTTKQLLQQAISRLNPYQIARSKFFELTGENYLNSKPEQFSIEEDNLNNAINFNYTFTSDPFDIKTSIGYNLSYDSINDIAKITLNGTLSAKGSQKSRTTALENALNQLDFFNLARAFYSTNFVGAGRLALNPNAINQAVTYNKFEDTVNQIQFTVEFSNQYQVIDKDILKFDYTLSASPSIDVFAPVQFLKNGENGIFNLNFYKRGTISIQGSALGISDNLGSKIRTLAKEKLNNFITEHGAVNRVVTEDNLTSPKKSDNGFNYSFSISENCETQKYI